MEKLWFLFKILHVRGRNTYPCKGELCFILLGGVPTSFFLYTGFVTMFTYIVLIFDIYIYMMYVFFTYLYMFCLSSFFIHIFLIYCMQSFYFCFTLRCRNEFCLKCFRNTGCQSLSCYGFSSCKVFQEFVLG